MDRNTLIVVGIIALAVVIMVIVLAKRIMSGRISVPVGKRRAEGSFSAAKPDDRATTTATFDKAKFGTDNQVDVQGNTDARFNKMTAEDGNRFNIGTSATPADEKKKKS
jgi:hypothetical protein